MLKVQISFSGDFIFSYILGQSMVFFKAGCQEILMTHPKCNCVYNTFMPRISAQKPTYMYI